MCELNNRICIFETLKQEVSFIFYFSSYEFKEQMFVYVRSDLKNLNVIRIRSKEVLYRYLKYNHKVI